VELLSDILMSGAPRDACELFAGALDAVLLQVALAAEVEVVAVALEAQSLDGRCAAAIAGDTRVLHGVVLAVPVQPPLAVTLLLLQSLLQRL